VQDRVLLYNVGKHKTHYEWGFIRVHGRQWNGIWHTLLEKIILMREEIKTTRHTLMVSVCAKWRSIIVVN